MEYSIKSGTNFFDIILNKLTGSAYLRHAYLSGKLRTKKIVNPLLKVSRHAPAKDINLVI